MQLSRIDLADLHVPTEIARAIFAQLGTIDAPVPTSQIARALGVADIKAQVFDGFEGMLLTDTVRSTGSILANTRYGDRRARFTVAHELGHFLMERHKLSGDRGFTCKAQDMRETRADKRQYRQESEANAFAINLLAPFKLFDPLLSQGPDLKDAQRLRDHLNISLEATIRRMIDRREECLAAVWSQNGQVRYSVKSGKFPWITRKRGERLHQLSLASKIVTSGSKGFSNVTETNPLAWLSRSDVELFEQTRVANNGHAVTLLWAELADADDDEDDGGLTELTMPAFR
ncbi:ImmA/IrrE family metallo-endopeptidase [Pseudohalocynthiibacter aestuariivivens]|nr:ImmA/IrrE family metallo-endopeptidase [Pseudohalocynthiibacter aestuariivivens]QIE45216.1 ImmA/IrrE family metallo-endopeptidase [Pseudohalocynthiibacter aestuariivivens]